MFRGVPSGSHCPAHSPPRGTHLRIRSATLVRFPAPQGRCRTGRELDGCLNRPLPRPVPAPVVLGLRVHRDRSAAPLAPAGAAGTGDAARRPVGRRPCPAHRLQPLRAARRVLPEPRLLALLDRGAHGGRPAHRTDLRHRAATGPRARRLARALRRPGSVPRAWLPRRCLPPAGRLAPLSAAPARPRRGRPRLRRAPLGTGYGQQPLLGRPVGPDHTPPPARSFRRADLDHGAAEDRPTDLDYGRYVRLATDYRDGRYADGQASSRSRTRPSTRCSSPPSTHSPASHGSWARPARPGTRARSGSPGC